MMIRRHLFTVDIDSPQFSALLNLLMEMTSSMNIADPRPFGVEYKPLDIYELNAVYVTTLLMIQFKMMTMTRAVHNRVLLNVLTDKLINKIDNIRGSSLLNVMSTLGSKLSKIPVDLYHPSKLGVDIKYPNDSFEFNIWMSVKSCYTDMLTKMAPKDERRMLISILSVVNQSVVSSEWKPIGFSLLFILSQHPYIRQELPRLEMLSPCMYLCEILIT